MYIENIWIFLFFYMAIITINFWCYIELVNCNKTWSVQLHLLFFLTIIHQTISTQVLTWLFLICLDKSPRSFPTNEHSALKHLHGFLYLNWKLSPALRLSSVLISILLQSLVTWILVIILHYLQIFLSFNFFISCYGALSLYLNWIWSVYLS